MKTYVRDFAVALVALVAGAITAAVLHGLWFSGPIMHAFGDPPGANPAYGFFNPIFQQLPYLASGAVAGLIASFGTPLIGHFLVRFLGPMALCMILSTKEHSFAIYRYLPMALLAVAIGSFLSSRRKRSQPPARKNEPNQSPQTTRAFGPRV